MASLSEFLCKREETQRLSLRVMKKQHLGHFLLPSFDKHGRWR